MSELLENYLTPTTLAELKRIELRTRRSLDSSLLGSYKSAFRGSGLVFSDIREYQPGDDVRSIHWKITARTGKTYVKDYEEDRRLTIIIAVDTSSSTAFGSSRTNEQRIIEFSALLTMLARTTRDSVGLCLFDSKVHTYIPPLQSGRNQFQRVLSTLIGHRIPGSSTDINIAINHIMSYQKKRAIVFLLSDFYAPDFSQNLKFLSTRHEVICAHFNDPTEVNIPRIGLLNVRDAESGKHYSIDTSSKKARNALHESFTQHSRKTSEKIRSAGAEYFACSNNPLQSLSRLMKNRTARRR